MAINLKIKMTPEASTIAKQLGKRNYKQKLDTELARLSKKINENIKTEAPVRTGNLRDAHRQHKLKQFSYEGYIDGRMKAFKYYRFVRNGTAPHIIKPKIKKALFWPGLSHPVKYVRHPGTKRNDWIERGINSSNSDIEKAEQKMMVAVEKEILSG